MVRQNSPNPDSRAVRELAQVFLKLGVTAFGGPAASSPFLPRLRRSSLLASVLDGVNVASLALMAAVTWQLGHAALVGLLVAT